MIQPFYPETICNEIKQRIINKRMGIAFLNNLATNSFILVGSKLGCTLLSHLCRLGYVLTCSSTFTNESVRSGKMASAMACGSTMNTRDFDLQSVINFLTKEGKKPKEIHEKTNAVYCDVSPSYYQV